MYPTLNKVSKKKKKNDLCSKPSMYWDYHNLGHFSLQGNAKDIGLFIRATQYGRRKQWNASVHCLK